MSRPAVPPVPPETVWRARLAVGGILLLMLTAWSGLLIGQSVTVVTVMSVITVVTAVTVGTEVTLVRVVYCCSC